MRIISFKQMTLFKRGIWLSAAALMFFALAPSVLAGSLWQNPVPAAAALCLLAAFLGYFLWRLPIHRLADVVIDCNDHLVARRRWTQENIPLSNIVAAEVLTGLGIHRIRIQLRVPTSLGRHIEFLPQASLWSSLSGVQQIASDLADRANLANGQRSVSGPVGR